MRHAFLRADRLRRERELAGMRQQDLADKIGVDRSAVACWERGVRQPGSARFAALCDALNLDPADLLNQTESAA